MIENLLREELINKGAVLVGYGDLSELPANIRHNMPVGICVAVKYPKDVIKSIFNGPNTEYLYEYNRLNTLLDSIVTHGEKILQQNGYSAIAQTRNQVKKCQTEYSSLLPHKTVATRAGLGWIGKCALLVTEEYGSMIRISTILTDAPLTAVQPVNYSKCGNCTECAAACYGKAVKGKEWSVSTQRDEFFDAVSCWKTTRKISYEKLHKDATLCGKCIVVCPYTRRYLNIA